MRISRFVPAIGLTLLAMAVLIRGPDPPSSETGVFMTPMNDVVNVSTNISDLEDADNTFVTIGIRILPLTPDHAPFVQRHGVVVGFTTENCGCDDNSPISVTPTVIKNERWSEKRPLARPDRAPAPVHQANLNPTSWRDNDAGV
jgi:hypothetical protein